MADTMTVVRSQVLAVASVCLLVSCVVAGASVGIGEAANGNVTPSFSEGTIIEASDSVVDTDSLTIQTAPRSTFRYLDTVSNVSEFATNDEAIAAGDALIFRLSAPGLSDALDASNNSNSTEKRLLELVQSGVIDLQIRQTNVTSNTKTFNLSATIENGGLAVLYEDDTAYVAINTERALFDQDGTIVHAEPGNRFEATFEGNNDSLATVSKRFRIVPRTASFDAETIDGRKVVVEADVNQTVAGQTTVAPQTELTIRAQSNGTSSFVIMQSVRVRADGTFSLDFDFANVTRGTSFELMIPNQGFENNASVGGVVLRPPTASVRLTSQHVNTENGQTVVIRSINLSDGGFVAVYNRSFFNNNGTIPSGSLRGTSRYLSSGKHTNVRIPLDRPYTHDGTVVVVPHQDTNNDEKYDFIESNVSTDSPYVGADGDPIVASANVTVRQTGSKTRTRMGPETGGDGENAVPPPQVSSPQATSTVAMSSATATSGPDGNKNRNGTEKTKSVGSGSGEERSGDGDGSGGADGVGGDGSPTSGSDTAIPQQKERSPNTQEMTTEALGPGFGVVIGFVALCLAALLIRRNG